MAPVLLIISIMRKLCTLSLFAAIFTAGFVSEANAEAAPASDVVREMNLARQQPILYAKFLEEQRAGYRGPEGTRALEEAIRFLRSASPRQALTASPGMSRAAVDHCAEQAGGGMSHSGRFGSSPGDRLNRYGTWGGHWGENLSCGRGSAREVVIGLTIDEGQPARTPPTNTFTPASNFPRAPLGPPPPTPPLPPPAALPLLASAPPRSSPEGPRGGHPLRSPRRSTCSPESRRSSTVCGVCSCSCRSWANTSRPGSTTTLAIGR